MSIVQRRPADAAGAARWARRRMAALLTVGLAALALALGAAVWRSLGQAPALAYWPFAWRYDPDLPVSPHTWRQRWLALAQSAAALALLCGALFAKRRRLAWLGAAVALALLTDWPNPRMLLVEAHSSSYQRSPLPFSDANLLQGGRLYQAHCAACHGAAADGRGERAASLPVWPSVLGPALFQNRLEGELHWRIAQGGQEPAANPAMPAFGAMLNTEEIWQVLDYLRLRAYGVSGGSGMPAVAAPVVALACRDGRATRLSGLRGLPLRVMAYAQGAAEEPQDPRLLTVALTRGHTQRVDADCVAAGVEAWNAYALAAGVSPDELAGAQFMVDRQGWLRARRLPGAAPAWTSADDVCGPGGRMEGATARGLGQLLQAMDRAPIAIPDMRREH
ncbi:c-type cytochrome [Achromobacter aegrifaciens]|uniref:c-type cytochrome n=1 Tax=Achromobacter aegrifaciens TaxID=1287736 RepID=UPI001FCCA703|nr:c-type cytochrome [Achromobacter aegrifaciens]